MVFTNDNHPCESHLVHKYGKEMLEEALNNGYITTFGLTSDGETQYTITEKGKNKRDN